MSLTVHRTHPRSALRLPIPRGDIGASSDGDGQIRDVVWTVESPGTEQLYTHERAKERERSQIAELSAEEFRRQLADFTALDQAELSDILQDKHDAEETDATPASFEEQLLQGVLDGTFDNEDLARAQEAASLLSRATADANQLCYRCHSSIWVAACTVCGDLVCSTHRDMATGICLECL